MANSHMLVYSPVTESSFMSRRLPDAKVNVSCSFSGDKRVFYRVLFLVYCYKECSRYQMWSSHGASLICLRIKWQLKWILTANVMRWHSIRKCGSNIYCLKSRWQSIKWWNTKNYLQRQLLAVKLRYLELIILSGWDDLKFLALLFLYVTLSNREEANYDQHQAGEVRRKRRSLEYDMMQHNLDNIPLNYTHFRY